MIKKKKTKNNKQDGRIINKSFIEYAKRDCSNMLEYKLHRLLKSYVTRLLQMAIFINHMSQMQITKN